MGKRISRILLNEDWIALYHYLMFEDDGISASLFLKNFEAFAKDAYSLQQLLLDSLEK
jgi:hypothetical protein